MQFFALFRSEYLCLAVKVHYHRAVVYLIRYRESRIVVVRRAYEPHILGQQYVSAPQLHGVGVPLVRYHRKLAFVGVGQFEEREELCKVILYPRYVHFVEHGYIYVLAVTRLVHLLQQVRLVETFGEFVVISYEVGSFLPHRLDGNDR